MKSCVETADNSKRAEFLVSESENERMNRVLSLLPQSAGSILEIGARHGAMTERLARRCEDVTALDLEKPSFEIDNVTSVQGDVQRLQFPDSSFDCVVCTEVLEHLPDISAGAHEIVGVARSHILIGVPYRQDRRVGRMTCVHCGRINPAYGHLNEFDEKVITRLFAGSKVSSVEYVSMNKERTNSLSTWLQDFGRNPYGAYDQEEPCIYCNQRLERPQQCSFLRRTAGALGARLYEKQFASNRARPTWMLVLLEKKHSQEAAQYDQDHSYAHRDHSQRGWSAVVTAPLYIVETIHTPIGSITMNRYPTLFNAEEAMNEKTIRIFSDKSKPFERHDADYVLYHVEGCETAGRWRILRRMQGEAISKAILERHLEAVNSEQSLQTTEECNLAA